MAEKHLVSNPTLTEELWEAAEGLDTALRRRYPDECEETMPIGQEAGLWLSTISMLLMIRYGELPENFGLEDWNG
jgi:hypothetical protein